MAENALSVLLGELSRVAGKANESGMPVIIGGGVGLLLRDQHIRENQIPTLRSYPPLRATADLDVILTEEIISDASKTEALRTILDGLGFKPIENARYFQFSKPMPAGGPLSEVRLDLLAPIPREGEVKVKNRRIRPRNFSGLHAHKTPEALTVEEYLTRVTLPLGDADVPVYIPHPFSYILLKLFAFEDLWEDPKKDQGRYHAFDIYISMAMMTEEQFEQGLELRSRFAAFEEMAVARDIAKRRFDSDTDMGVIRIREHLRETGRPEEGVDIDGFLRDLRDLLT